MAKFSTLVFELIFSLALLSKVRGIDYFTSFCQNGLYGAQGYVQVPDYWSTYSRRCVIRFPLSSKDRAQAEDICTENSPYRVYSANYGDTTECYYDWPTQSCAGNELALFNNCYEVRGYGQYHQFNKACGGSVKPHSVESQLEASWLAYFLGDGNPEVWIANGEALDYYEEIKPVKQKMKRKLIKKYGEYKGPAPVKLRMKQLSDGIQRGQAIFAHPNESHSFLCSKSGVYLKQGIEHLVSEAEKLDFDIKQLFDNNGLPRPFIRFNWVQPVQATKYDADITKMHEICRVFVNGYVASRFDFQNDTEYQKIFQANTRAFKVFRVPIKRHKSVTVDPFCPDATAAKRAEFKNTMQKRFSYITLGGNMSTVPVEHWQSEFPKNLCADTPRITVAMTPKGYRDYPAITRLPVLCTFGNPPDLKTRPEDSICPKGAHYDSKKQQCQCNDPNTDGRKVDPESFGHLPEGSICLSCFQQKKKQSIIFVMDVTGSIGDEGLKKQQEFATKMINLMPKIRAGAVLISCPAKVLLQMGEHSKTELSNWIEKASQIRAKDDGGYTHLTDTATAYEELEKMSNNDNSDIKTVIVMSDGESSNCFHGVPKALDPSQQTEFDVSDRLKAKSVNFLYLFIYGVQGEKDKPNAMWVVGNDPSKFISVEDVNSLAPKMADVINKICAQKDYS